MPKLLLATTNPGKIADLRLLFEGCGWALVTPRDLGIALDVEETGETYADNAREKALAGMHASGLVALSDDSGIEIEALGGEPGVQSARFLGADATYAERFAEIERRLAGVPRERRACRFVCVMAVADPRTGDVRLSEGEVRGLVSEEPRGEGGFGYAPIFWLPQHTATMAELPEHQRNIINHRARAAAHARQALRELLHAHQEADPSYSR
ncbi:MAG: non-canonical purine NTP pyrophosphatase [Dehalococcoidia bacterium]